jgi:cytoskeletal protein CcmA (bactofilin family)
MFALSLFSSSSDDADDPAESSDTSVSTSIIGEGADIEGILEFTDTDLHIEGTVHGDISTDGRVLVAEGAEVRGTIYGETIQVAGYVEGHVEAEAELVLRPMSEVHATLEADVLEIQPGADFSGEVPDAKEVPSPESPSMSTADLGSTDVLPNPDSAPAEPVEAQ